MRLSCNGCRVLRKGCSDSCSIRPCLEWIKTSDSQAHATVFLAKFYGRAGLMNLINAGQQHLRPAIFKSLLYEACGRIVNPINGSVGLLWSGSWQLCENAVAAVLSGAPVTRMETDAAETKSGPPLKVYDIRHVSKEENNVSGFGELHQVRTRRMFKRVGKGKKGRVAAASDESANRSPSHESSLSHQSEANAERESLPSAETNEAEHVTGDEMTMDPGEGDGGLRISDGEIELDLTLGLEPFKPTEPKRRRVSIGAAEDASGVCKMELVNFDG